MCKFERIVVELVNHFKDEPKQLATFEAIRSAAFDALIEKYGRITMSSVKSWSIADDMAESVLDHLGA